MYFALHEQMSVAKENKKQQNAALLGSLREIKVEEKEDLLIFNVKKLGLRIQPTLVEVLIYN